MTIMHTESTESTSAAKQAAHPFSSLGPSRVLDAIESVGLRGDGRLLALNSYENRVYQVGREEGEPVVVKFYRPARWTDEAILPGAGQLCAKSHPFKIVCHKR